MSGIASNHHLAASICRVDPRAHRTLAPSLDPTTNSCASPTKAAAAALGRSRRTRRCGLPRWKRTVPGSCCTATPIRSPRLAQASRSSSPSWRTRKRSGTERRPGGGVPQASGCRPVSVAARASGSRLPAVSQCARKAAIARSTRRTRQATASEHHQPPRVRRRRPRSSTSTSVRRRGSASGAKPGRTRCPPTSSIKPTGREWSFRANGSDA